MIIVLDIHHNHQFFETKCSGNLARSWKHCEWKTSYDWKCPKSWSFYDYTYYDAYFKVMYVLQRTRFSSSLSAHKIGAHHPSTAMFQWMCMWWEHRILHLCLNAKMTSSLFQKILLQV